MHTEITQNWFKLLSDMQKQITGKTFKTLYLIFNFSLSVYDIYIIHRYIYICDRVCCMWMQAFAWNCAYVKVIDQTLYRLSPSTLIEEVSCCPLFLPGLLAYQSAAILLSLSFISKYK